MRSTYDRQKLLRAVRVAALATDDNKIDKNDPANFLKADGSSLTAWRRDLYCRVDSAALEGDPGAALLHPTRTAEILTVARTDTIILESSEEGVLWEAGLASWEVAAPQPEGFPDPPEFKPSLTCEVSADALLAALDAVGFSTAHRLQDHEVWQGILGVQLSFRDNELVVSASNGYRFLFAQVAAKGEPWKGAPIIGRKTVDAVEEFLKLQEGQVVNIEADRSWAACRAGNDLMACRQLEGKYPDWRQCVPKEWKGQVSLPVAKFRSAVRSSCTFGSGSLRPVSFRFRPDRLELAATHSTGRSVCRIPCSCPAEHEEDHNGRMLNPVLDRLPQDGTVTLSYGSSQGALLLDAGNGVRCVISALAPKKGNKT